MKSQSEQKKESFLVVDDEKSICKVLQELLLHLGFTADFEISAMKALSRLRDGHFTFLITDINMPDLNGIDLIKTLREENIKLNTIVMTGYDNNYSYVDVIDAGANDFIIKPFKVGEVEAKIKRILSENKIRDELARLSITDNLTGLYNQRHFYDKINEEVKRANRQNRPLSLILLDLDKFKNYNDTYGHLAGDKVLAETGPIILLNIRDDVDIAFRYGGDEFAVILVEADCDVAKTISERLKKGFIESASITASIGIATYSQGIGIKEFIAIADKDLYREKGANISI